MNGQRYISFAEMGRDPNKFARMRKRQGHFYHVMLLPPFVIALIIDGVATIKRRNSQC
jgi:hypothetical protein